MSYLKQFLGKEPSKIKPKDVEKFIEEKVEENLNLDYKDIRAIENYDELAKDVSAFANSEGGCIFLGVSEEEQPISNGKRRIFPMEITWGDKSLSKEQLENNLIGKIHSRIEGLRIIPIRKTNQKVIFLIDIPQSPNPPHMASPYNRYYKRLNFQSVPMEHYEVSDFFGRRRKPLLNLLIKIFEVDILPGRPWTLTLGFAIINKGKGVAKSVQFSANLYNVEIMETSFTRLDDVRFKPSIQFHSKPEQVMYPDSTMPYGIGTVKVKIVDIMGPLKGNYWVYAEDMGHIEGSFDLSFEDIREKMESIKNGKGIIEVEEKLIPFGEDK